MAEKSDKKSKRRKVEIKDAGQRQVFVGLEMDSQKVAAMLAEASGQKFADDRARQAAGEKLLKLLSVEEGGGCIVWVPVGDPVNGSPSKREAIDAVVGNDRPGRYRAPTCTAWRGELRRTPPKQVSLDEELVD